MKLAELVAALEHAAEDAAGERAKSRRLEDDNQAASLALFTAVGYLLAGGEGGRGEPMRVRAIAALRAIGSRPVGAELPWLKKPAPRCDRTAELPGLPAPDPSRVALYSNGFKCGGGAS